MDIEGTIIQILDPDGGVSQRTGNQWKKQGYVLETGGEFPRKVKFDVWNDRLQGFELQKRYSVSVDIESREYNGRWYTDVSAYSMRPLEGGPTGPTQQFPPVQNPYNNAPQNNFSQPQAATQNNPINNAPDFKESEQGDDLPF